MSKDREFVATVTRKGQVTIPAEVREQLGLSPHDKVVFRLSKGNKVEIEPLPMTLEEERLKSGTALDESSVEDDPLWGVVGLGDSGLGNLSAEHDRYLTEPEETGNAS